MVETENKIEIQGQELSLLAERAVFWRAQNTLIVADLHWGKDETFRQRGIPIPAGVIEDDLSQLTRAITYTGAERLLVLGDLIHAKIGLSERVIERVARWRAEVPVAFTAIRGNHDRHFKIVPPSWHLEFIDDEILKSPFAFLHQPKKIEGYYTLCGHIHPVVKLRGASDRLRLPCFHFGKDIGVLPAFSRFTGGCEIPKQASDRIFAIAENRVLEI